MKKEWFVLHTLTGQENKAMKSILARKVVEGVQDFIGECIIPTEKVSEKRTDKKGQSHTVTVTKKFFPGYVLCEMALYDEAKSADPITKRRPVHEEVWQFLRSTPGVIGFVGVTKENPDQPIPLKQSELDAIMDNGKGAHDAPPRPKILFNVGDNVKINDGPFLGLRGVVSVVDPDKGNLKVEVDIFNRRVLVDAESWQVEKLSDEELLESAPQA